MLAAKKLNLPTEQCLVVEDAVPGILAAAAAKMKAVAVGAAQGCSSANCSYPNLEGIDIDALLDWEIYAKE